MRNLKIAVITIIAVGLMSTAAFAQNDISPKQNVNLDSKGNNSEGVKKDPIQHLEKAKVRVQQKLADKEISEEEANKIIESIDKKIKTIQDFNKLTLQQKKDKLLNDFKAYTGKRVQEGNLTQEKADKALENFKAKIEKWDGNGYPHFFHKVGMGFGKEMNGHCGKRFENALDKAVKDGKITKQQRDTLLDYLKK